jgi:hypothetical protein
MNLQKKKKMKCLYQTTLDKNQDREIKNSVWGDNVYEAGSECMPQPAV